jgi:hypothetical protein
MISILSRFFGNASHGFTHIIHGDIFRQLAHTDHQGGLAIGRHKSLQNTEPRLAISGFDFAPSQPLEQDVTAEALTWS